MVLFPFQDLLLLEEQEGSVNFKFGVLYTKPQQVTDDEMFSNGMIKLMAEQTGLKELVIFYPSRTD